MSCYPCTSSCTNVCANVCTGACSSSCACTSGCTGGCHAGGWYPPPPPPPYPGYADGAYCPYPEWMHPIHCNPAHYCCAGAAEGATLVIHQIVLEADGGQSCTPRSFNIRITGPSYPAGEVFTLRAGSCTELDEPLVISGLLPGTYTIETLFGRCRRFISTITGPVCGNSVQLVASPVPTVVTIVSRLVLGGCGGCHCHHACHTWC